MIDYNKLLEERSKELDDYRTEVRSEIAALTRSELIDYIVFWRSQKYMLSNF